MSDRSDIAKRPVSHKKWDPQAMNKAVEAVRNKEMGYLKAHKHFGVPKSTLEDYVKRNMTVEEMITVRIGRKPDLPSHLEKMLVEYLVEMDKRFFGLRSSDLRRLAFQLADKNNLKHRFTNGAPGKKWQRNFLHRHPELTFRKPQAISAARVKGFNRENVEEFFNIYEKELEKIQHQPHKVYNVDETGVTIVQHKTSRVIALKGKKQVASLSSAERGSLVTLVTCMGATGHFIPPMFVFPRKNMKPELMDGAPPGSISDCHLSGWIQSEGFTKWLQHFIQHAKPTAEDPVILVLDGHYSHTRNLDVINVARVNGVIIVCLPPHSTHKMQPLDVAFMSPFKTFYAQEIETWLKNHPNRLVTTYQIAEMVGKAFERSATLKNAVNGFKKTGLFPCNRFVFQDHEFAINSEPMESTLSNQQDSQGESTTPNNPPISSLNQSAVAQADDGEKSSFQPLEALITPADISPIPTMINRKTGIQTGKQRGRKAGKAALITGSPYKEELVESLEKMAHKKGKMPEKFKCLKDQGPSTSKPKILSNIKIEMCEICRGFILSQTSLKCSACKKYSHYSCVPKNHRANIPESDEEDLYICQKCYILESDNDSVDSEELLDLVRNCE